MEKYLVKLQFVLTKQIKTKGRNKHGEKITHYPADHLLRQIIDAIDTGDLEDAKKKATIMFNGAKTYHDGVLDMFSLALNYMLYIQKTIWMSR